VPRRPEKKLPKACEKREEQVKEGQVGIRSKIEAIWVENKGTGRCPRVKKRKRGDVFVGA